MVTPRRPTEHGGVERHVMEVSRRIAAAGAEVEVLCGDPEVHGVDTELPRRRRDPRRPGLAGKARLVPGAAALAGDRAGAARPDPHPVLPHAGRAAGDAARARSSGSRTSSPFMAAGTPRGSATASAACSCSCCAPCFRARAGWSPSPDSRSTATARALGVPPERFVLIPNGTDIDRRRVGGGDGSATLATIGRLERYKGHHRVLAAFPDVLREPARRAAAGRRQGALRVRAPPAGRRARGRRAGRVHQRHRRATRPPWASFSDRSGWWCC